MRTLELRRHAARQNDADALTPEGRVQAEDLGRTLTHDYDALFVSPARRAAETAAWILRGAGRQLREHAVVPGLTSDETDRWIRAVRTARTSRLDGLTLADPEFVGDEVTRLSSVVGELFDRLPDGGRALVIGHTPLLEAAVYGLTGVVVEPLSECEGIAVTREDDGSYRIEELRASPSVGT